MSDVVLKTSFEISGADLKKAFAADTDFKADRLGHNNPTSVAPSLSRITYMCHAKGYVMARRPSCNPFVISEKLWRSFPLWGETR